MLVDEADDARLGELVRALLGDHPDLAVCAAPSAVMALPPGSTVVFRPRPAHAAWLNLQRPIFAQRALKVALWCDHTTSVALSRQAPDFFDWISSHTTCPPAPVPHAVRTLRAAATAPGLLWTPHLTQDDDALPRVFATAFPDATLHEADGTAAFEVLIAQARSTGWLHWRGVDSDFRMRRLRWARAQAGRTGHDIVHVNPTHPVTAPGWWSLDPRLLSLDQAIDRLAVTPLAGHLAALADLEPATIDQLAHLLEARVPDVQLAEVLQRGPDGGAELARWLRETEHDSVSADGFAAPVLRAFGSTPADPVDEVLRLIAREADANTIATTMRALGDPGAARWFQPDPQAPGFSPQRPAFTVPWPSKGDKLVGREDAMARLRAQLHQGRPTAIGQTAAFVGLGGIGKTQLAVEYAWRHRDDYPDGVYWFHADQDISAQLVRLADEAGWVPPESDHAHKLAVARERIRSHSDCLIIFDNVVSIDDIREILPKPGVRPHLLLTSREPVDGFWAVDLALLDEERSRLLLAKESGRPLDTLEDRAAASRIHHQLDGLPLAVELAGARQRHRPVSWTEYADMLERSGAETQALRPPAFTAESLTRHEASLISTLRLSETLMDGQPWLREALQVLAWSGTASMSLDLLRAVVEPDDADAMRASLALTVRLHVVIEEAGPRFRLHRLVQQVTRALDGVEAHARRAQGYARRLGDWFQARRREFKHLAEYEREADHLTAWAEQARQLGDTREEARLLWLRAYPAYHRGQYPESERLVIAAWRCLEATSVEDPDLRDEITLDRATLAVMLGRPREAEALAHKVLDHSNLSQITPREASAYKVLGDAKGQLGQPRAAAALLRRSLDCFTRIEPEGGPGTLTAKTGLAIALNNAGRHAEAITLLEQAVATADHSDGPQSPAAGNTRRVLADALLLKKKLNRALPLAKRALTTLHNTAGEDHPDTANALRTLAWARQQQGRHNDALPLYQRAHSILHDGGHGAAPDVASDLAATLWDLGRRTEARALLRDTLAMLPPDSPKRARIQRLLADMDPKPSSQTGARHKARKKASRAARKKNQRGKRR